MKASNICCLIFGILLAYILNLLRNVGEFQFLYPKNVRQCSRIEGYHGCEDFAYFNDGTLIMSCDDRSWLKYETIMDVNLSQRIINQPNQGSLYSLLPSNTYKTANKITLKNFNYADFHPLGIASYQNKKDGKWIYVTDNQRDAERVHFFKVITNNNNDDIVLDYHGSAINEDFGMLNDIIAVPNGNGAFYTTIWLPNEPGTFSCFLDVMLMRPVAYVLYCEPPKQYKNDFLSNDMKEGREVRFECHRVLEFLKMANGITQSPDGKKVYVSETISKTLNIYQRNEKTNDLTLIKKVSTFSGCDNVEYADDGYLYLGCHPKALTFQFHARFPKSILSPSRVLKYKDTDSEDDNMEILMESVGEILAGSSLGFPIKGNMIVGSVHDSCYLLCENFYDNLDKNDEH